MHQLPIATLRGARVIVEEHTWSLRDGGSSGNYWEAYRCEGDPIMEKFEKLAGVAHPCLW